jgi:formylglycine-generating enzyme required for sulfatase activity
MQGNVAEWCSDIYGYDFYSASPDSNPTGPEKGKFRVIRGGGWHTGPSCTTVAFRNGLRSNWKDFGVGIRCAKDYP